MAGVFINLDPVGTLRRIQDDVRPDPIAAAAYIQMAGAAGVAASLGVEGGPLSERDLRMLRDTVHSRLLISIPAAAELLGLAMDLRPDLCIINAMGQQARAPRNGIDLVVHHKEIADSLKALQNNGIQTLIFIDPQPEQIKLALQAGADGVVINTTGFSTSFSRGYALEALAEQPPQHVSLLRDCIKLAHRLKLSPWLTGGLGYENLTALTGLPEIHYILVGHSVISRALFTGLHLAVEDIAAMAAGLANAP
jgi:pyridoxine 5-phosphate synthase